MGKSIRNLSTVTRVGLDLAKRVFQVHAVDAKGGLSQVLITSQSHLAVAQEALRVCPRVKLAVVVDGPGDGDAVRNLDEATTVFPETPIPDESTGWAMLYSSGTTGQPKGILRPLADTPARHLTPLAAKSASCRRRSTTLRPRWRRG